jgi:hypothetical protein
MKDFIKRMISSSDDTSHKRVIAIAAFIVLVCMVIAKFFGANLDEDLIYVFAALTAGQSGLTVIEKIFNKPPQL